MPDTPDVAQGPSSPPEGGPARPEAATNGTVDPHDLVVDKTSWPPGPWHDEPDRLQWKTAAGLPGLLVRHSRLGHLCGYAAVPPEVATKAPWTTEHPHIGGSGGVRRAPIPEPEEERCVGCGRTPSEGVGCSSCPGYNDQGYPPEEEVCEWCGRARSVASFPQPGGDVDICQECWEDARHVR